MQSQLIRCLGCRLLNVIGFILALFRFVFMGGLQKPSVYLYQNVSPRAKTPLGCHQWCRHSRRKKNQKRIWKTRWLSIDDTFALLEGENKARRRNKKWWVSCLPSACHATSFSRVPMFSVHCARISHVTKSSVLCSVNRCWRPTADWKYLTRPHGTEVSAGKEKSCRFVEQQANGSILWWLQAAWWS